MVHKERIAWFLALQQLFKLPKNRIAPTVLALAKQSRLSGEKTTASAPAFPRQSASFSASTFLPQSTSFVDRSKALIRTNTASSLYQDKIQTRRSNTGTVRPASLTPILPDREYRTLPRAVQLATMLDHRFVVSHTFGHDPGRRQMRIEQLTGKQKLSAATTAGSTSFKDKAFAPGQVHLPGQLNNNDEPRNVAQLLTNASNALIGVDRGSGISRVDPEHPTSKASNPISPLQEKETNVDQSQALSGSNASTSTLHLDGSSLGRWAIQHFERVLSKPPSGITGVDPRATVPRSRVAPF